MFLNILSALFLYHPLHLHCLPIHPQLKSFLFFSFAALISHHLYLLFSSLVLPTLFLFIFPFFLKITQGCMLIIEDLEQETMDEKHIIFLFLCLSYLTQYTQHNISTSLHLPAILRLSFLCSIVYMYPIFIIHLSFERYLGFPVF